MADLERVVRVDPSRARAKTASAMTKAQQEIPSFHLTRHVSSERLAATAVEDGISVTAALMHPIARWLTEYEGINGHIRDDQFEASATVNLGVAVAHRLNVLIVVTLKDCSSWTPADFADALASIRAKNDQNSFAPADFARPSFTVSNLGGFGIDEFTSIVTPPQVGVLSVGAVRRTPVCRDQVVGSELVMSLTLGLDHRAVDGAYGARALARLDELVQLRPVLANKGIVP